MVKKIVKQEVDRRFVGLRVSSGNFQSVHALYEVTYWWKEGKTFRSEIKFETGHSVFTVPSFDELNKKNPTLRDKTKWKLDNRPDLSVIMQAAKPLFTALQEACLKLDDFHAKKKKK